MLAKFPGTCRCCQMAIIPGKSNVAKDAVRGWVHVVCVTAPATASAPRARSQKSLARRNYEETGDYYGSGLYDAES